MSFIAELPKAELHREYALIAAAFGLSDSTLAQIAANGLSHRCSRAGA